MPNHARTFVFILALTPLLAAASDPKWEFAGESQGIAFQLKITNACRDKSKVAIRIRNTLDKPVVVSFRLNDSDWRKTFTRPLKANGKDASLTFVPEDSQVCHPYVDQVYLESEEEVAAQSASHSEGPSEPPAE